jgi:hypothetical protein
MKFERRELRETQNESKYYKLVKRYSVGLSSNSVWLYTVDVTEDIQAKKPIVRLRRWVARFADGKAVWRPTRAYNVRSKEQWDQAAGVIEASLHDLRRMADPRFRPAIQLLGGSEAPVGSQPAPDSPTASPTDAQVPVPTEDEFERELLQARAEKRVAEKRYRELRKHVRTYRHVLGRFRRLVDDPGTGETEIHEFIETAAPRWLFGLEYADIESEVYFPPGKKEFRFDLMLKRFDGFKDLVELKSPNARLFRKATERRSRLTSPLAEALGQVVAYLNACDLYQRTDLFRPKAFIVIGNKNTDDEKQRRLLQSHLTQVEILTYSSLIERGESLLQHLRGKGRAVL